MKTATSVFVRVYTRLAVRAVEEGMIDPINRQRPSAATQIGDLFLVELSNFRWAWRSMVLTGMVAPLTFIVALKFLTGADDQQTLSYVLVGNIVLSLMFETLNRLSGHFAYIRFGGMLDYFATLPISRANLILAAALAFLVMALPAILVTIIGGALILRVPLNPSPALLLAIPLAALPLTGIGAYIGVRARTPEEAGAISTLLTLLMLALGPVLIPADQLPPLLRVLGFLSPATYAASAIRQTLLGPITPRLALDFVVLTALSVVTLWLVGRKLAWRQR